MVHSRVVALNWKVQQGTWLCVLYAQVVLPRILSFMKPLRFDGLNMLRSDLLLAQQWRDQYYHIYHVHASYIEPRSKYYFNTGVPKLMRERLEPKFLACLYFLRMRVLLT